MNIEPQTLVENDPDTGVFKAREDGQRPDVVNSGQYENREKTETHGKWTDP